MTAKKLHRTKSSRDLVNHESLVELPYVILLICYNCYYGVGVVFSVWFCFKSSTADISSFLSLRQFSHLLLCRSPMAFVPLTLKLKEGQQRWKSLLIQLLIQVMYSPVFQINCIIILLKQEEWDKNKHHKI